MTFLETLQNSERQLFGMTVDFIDVTSDNIDLLQEIGVQHVRPIWYSETEQEKVKLNALAKRGFTILLPIECGYRHVQPAPLDDPDAYIETVASKAGETAREFRDTVPVFQLENEITNWRFHSMVGWRSGEWLRLPRKFTRALITEMSKVVKESAPDSLVTVNVDLLTSKKFGIYEQDLQLVQEILPAVDFLSLSLYPHYPKIFSSEPSQVREFLKQVKRDISKPLIIGETGHPCGPSRVGDFVSNCKYLLSQFFFSDYRTERVRALITSPHYNRNPTTVLKFNAYMSSYSQEWQAKYIRNLRKLTEEYIFVFWHKLATPMSTASNLTASIEERTAPTQEKYFGIMKRNGNSYSPTLGFYAFKELMNGDLKI